jgi:hypothetical protein
MIFTDADVLILPLVSEAIAMRIYDTFFGLWNIPVTDIWRGSGITDKGAVDIKRYLAYSRRSRCCRFDCRVCSVWNIAVIRW